MNKLASASHELSNWIFAKSQHLKIWRSSILTVVSLQGDNYSLYSSSDWLNLIILAEVLQYLRLPNKKLQIRKVLNGGADFLASKLIENLKLGEARDSHLENGIIFIVFTLRSILRLNLDVNKEVSRCSGASKFCCV